MNRRIGIIAASACLGLLLLLAAISQGRQLSNLREGQRDMLARLAAPSDQTAAKAAPVQRMETQNEGSPGSSELLRLRSEVNRLTRRKQELAGAFAENQRLKAELERAQTNSASALPPEYLNKGYIRRTTAQKAGFETPQATLETFLWAVQHHNPDAFLECLTPESRKKLQETQQNFGESFEKMFSHSDEIPGLRIMSSIPDGAGGLRLEVEAAPGMPMPSAMNVRQINGEWKLAFFE